MIPITTERLTLRNFQETDFEAVHSYAAFKENLIYLPFGPNTEEDTRDFIRRSVAGAAETPRTDYELAIILNETGQIIGSCSLYINEDNRGKGEIAWLLHRDYWQQGFGPEAAREVLALGFDELNLHRIVATCDAENYGSYRVMEKIGMRKEGLFIEGRPAGKLSPEKKYGDELLYAMTHDEWDTQKEMKYYGSLTAVFDGFIDVPLLSDGKIYLLCYEKQPAIPAKKYVPAYMFAICREGEKIGEISLRVGYTDGLYFGGQIGYAVEEKFRGNGYAVRACRLLKYVAKAHGMSKLLITNDYRNIASHRVCEKLGAKLLRQTIIPSWHNLYAEGQRYANVFEWTVE